MANEKRLIDANEFEKHFWQRGHDGEFRTLMDAELAIINAPTVDAVEVVHGRWVQKEFWPGGGTWRCSECGRQIMFTEDTPATMNMHYCPNCGAKMDGDGNEQTRSN